MRRLLAAAPLALVACTLFQPLDYLTDGPPLPAEGGAPDAAVEGGLVPDVVASGQSVPDLVAIDATDVYWHASGTGAILAVAKAGGTPRAIGQSAQSLIGFAVDPGSGGDVYWALDTQIFRAPKQGGDGGPGELVFTAPSPLVAFALDDTSIYVALPVDSTPGTIVRIPKGGGAPVALDAQDDPLALAVDATSIVWVDSATSTARLLAKAAAPDASTDGGSAATTVGNTTSDPIAPSSADLFVLGSDAFFWAELGTDSMFVYRHARTGADRRTVWVGDANAEIAGMTADAEFVWLTETTSKTLARVPRNGGDPQIVVGGVAGLGGVASDDANVYFASRGTSPTGGSILRVPAR